MTLSPKALATARRNLAQRIERFLNAETLATTEPDGWQCQNVETALECLEMDDHATGERAMLDAERLMRTGSVEPVIRSSDELMARLKAIKHHGIENAFTPNSTCCTTAAPSST